MQKPRTIQKHLNIDVKRLNAEMQILSIGLADAIAMVNMLKKITNKL